MTVAKRTTLATFGGFFDLADPRPEHVSIDDIAHALARINRYNGHARVAFSVARHSILCADIVKGWGGSVAEQLEALLHDAAEAYYGDTTWPMLAALRQAGAEEAIARVRGGVDSVVRGVFGVSSLPANHERVGA